MKAKTKQLLDLIHSKQKELREQRINKIIHQHTLNWKPSIIYDLAWEKYEERMNRYYAELDKRIDAALNKDAAKIRKQLFGY